jgi:CubicO group peptidase (beta-lactamase class C family)
MLLRVVSVVLATSVLAAQASTQGPPAGDDSSRIARVDAIFAQYDTPTTPGCAVAVYQDGRTVYRKAFGMANLDHDVRLTPRSVFHVASVSKQFTGAAIQLLALDGKLSLDDDVRKHVPELPDFGQTVTIRHLAHHTSGIRDQWDLLGLAGWRYSRDLITDDDVLQMLARQKALNFTPGARHLYSNSGYTLMALIVSRVSGQSFRDFTSSRIFKPLGMSNTHFRDNFGEIVKQQAYGYASEGNSYRLSVTNFDTAGATSLLTTVDDLAKWHANFDRRAVGGDGLIAGLLERGVLNDGRRIDYAFGVSHGTYRGLPTVAHGGADAGYRAMFLRFPNERLGVACLCNIASADPGGLARRVADVYLPKSLPREVTQPADDTPEVALTEQQLARYAGLYWNRAEATARRVALENGRLHATLGGERIALKSLGGGSFLMTAGARLRVMFEDGPDAILRLRTGPDPADVFVRAETYNPTRDQLADFAGVYRSDEMDVVFRVVLADAGLSLLRVKHRPAALGPIVADTFQAQQNTIQFVRDADGRVSGFVLNAGRVRQVKFWKEGTEREKGSGIRGKGN